MSPPTSAQFHTFSFVLRRVFGASASSTSCPSRRPRSRRPVIRLHRTASPPASWFLLEKFETSNNAPVMQAKETYPQLAARAHARLIFNQHLSTIMPKPALNSHRRRPGLPPWSRCMAGWQFVHAPPDSADSGQSSSSSSIFCPHPAGPRWTRARASKLAGGTESHDVTKTIPGPQNCGQWRSCHF